MASCYKLCLEMGKLSRSTCCRYPPSHSLSSFLSLSPTLYLMMKRERGSVRRMSGMNEGQGSNHSGQIRADELQQMRERKRQKEIERERERESERERRGRRASWLDPEQCSASRLPASQPRSRAPWHQGCLFISPSAWWRRSTGHRLDEPCRHALVNRTHGLV